MLRHHRFSAPAPLAAPIHSAHAGGGGACGDPATPVHPDVR